MAATGGSLHRCQNLAFSRAERRPRCGCHVLSGLAAVARARDRCGGGGSSSRCERHGDLRGAVSRAAVAGIPHGGVHRPARTHDGHVVWKLISLIYVLRDRKTVADHGGVTRPLASAVSEIIFSALLSRTAGSFC